MPKAIGQVDFLEKGGAQQGGGRRELSISMIIPTKNRPKELLETLPSIVALIRRPDELIIIDQSDQDYSAEVHRIVDGYPDMKVNYLWAPQVKGLVEARIRGVAESTGDIVFFVDDDIDMEEDSVRNLVRRYQEHPEYAGICGVDLKGTKLPWWLVLARRAYMLGPFHDDRSLMNKRCLGLSETRTVRLVSGGYMSYQRGIFDEFEFEGEMWGHRWNSSIDFSFRVSTKYPIVIDPTVQVSHRNAYGDHTPEEFVRIRVSGTFFFFQRNIPKSWINYGYFLLVLLAILVRTIWRGFETKALRRVLKAFFSEVRRGLKFLREPFKDSY